MKKNILIICWGNIHRSVVAEEFLRKLLAQRANKTQYQIASRGIQGTMGVAAPKHENLRGYPETYGLTTKALEKHAIAIPEDKISTPVSTEDAERADIILVLGNDVHEKLQTEWSNEPQLLEKMYALSDVQDPHGSTDEGHLQKVVEHIVADVHRFADEEL